MRAETTKSLSIDSGAASLAARAVGTGPAVVFLHAGVADKRSWYPTMASIASRYRAVAYDRRGFGDTSYEPEPHAHVDDLLAVLDSLDENDAVLVGHSQGGRIAIDAALAHPSRIRRLFLVAPAITGAPEPTAVPPEEAALDEAWERASGDLDAINEIEAHAWLDGPGSRRGRVGGDARALFLDMNGRALRAADPGAEREPAPAYERLGDISVPTCVLVGSLDLQHMQANARHLAACAPRGSLVVMDGVAHLPQLERRDELADSLATFLR